MSKLCPPGVDIIEGPKGGTYYVRNHKKVYCKRSIEAITKPLKSSSKKSSPKKTVAKKITKTTPKKITKTTPKKQSPKKTPKKTEKTPKTTPKKKESPKKKSSPKKKESPKKSTKQLNEDWTKVAIKSSDKNYDYWTVPENTILYKGVDVTFKDKILPSIPAFFASLDIASAYAFIPPGKDREGEYGKVITVITTKPIKLLDVSSSKTLTNIEKLSSAPVSTIEYAFGTPTEPKRKSNYDSDAQLSKWICDQGFHGFGYPKYAGFHNELMLCSTESLIRGDIEYRVIKNEQCLFEVSANDGFKRVLPNTIPMTNIGKRRNLKFYDTYSQTTNAADKYIVDIRKQAKELCEPLKTSYESLIHTAQTAVINRDIDGINKAIDKGIKPGYLIHTAINSGANDVILRLLVERGADPNFLAQSHTLDIDTIRFALDNGAKPSVFVVNVNDTKILTFLLDRGADSYLVAGKAISIKDITLLELALKRERRVTYSSSSQSQLITKSLMSGFYEGGELLLKYTDIQSIKSAVSTLSNDSTQKELLFLLDHGADPTSGLIGAFNTRQYEAARLLIDRGAKYTEFFEWLDFYSLGPELTALIEYADIRVPISDLDLLLTKIAKWKSDKNLLIDDRGLVEVLTKLKAKHKHSPKQSKHKKK